MPGKNKRVRIDNELPVEGILIDEGMEKASQRPSPSNPDRPDGPSEPTGEKPPITGPVNQAFEKSGQIRVDMEASNKGSTRKK